MASTRFKVAIASALAIAACAAPAGQPLFPSNDALDNAPITQAEAEAAVRAMVANHAPICMAWPGLWSEENDRGQIIVRYDRMRRDWGADVSAGREARMDEFVTMGFLTRRNDEGAAVYVLTDAGRRYFRAAEDEGGQPRFCAPPERRVTQVTAFETTPNACGSVRVRFTHVADAPPSWARTESSLARWQAASAPLGEVRAGSVSLARRNGGLASLCEPADLDLNAPR